MDKKQNAFKTFIKENLYYLIIATILVGLAVIVAVTTVNNSTNNTLNQNEPIIQVSGDTTTYTLPLSTFTILKDYSDTELMYNATLKRWESHKGIDLTCGDCNCNSCEVYAVSDGTVTAVYSNYLQGTVIEIEHADNIKSYYSSLSENTKVNVGDKVKKGDAIGTVGTTAKNEFTTTSHLHFEMSKDGVRVNPSVYIAFADK